MRYAIALPKLPGSLQSRSAGVCAESIAKLGVTVGMSSDQIDDLDNFRIALIDRVLTEARPPS